MQSGNASSQGGDSRAQGLFAPRFRGTASWHSLPASSEGGNGSSHFRIFNRKGSSASLQRGNAIRTFVPASSPSGKTRRNFRDDSSQGGNASLHCLPTRSHCRNSCSSRGQIVRTGLCQRAGVSHVRSLGLRGTKETGHPKPGWAQSISLPCPSLHVTESHFRRERAADRLSEPSVRVRSDCRRRVV